MKDSQRNLLSIIGYELNGTYQMESSKIGDWDVVFEEAQKHKLANLFTDALGQLWGKKIVDKPASFDMWKALSLKSFMMGTHIENVQKELLELFQESNIPYCILKGNSISSLYEKPRLRPSGDIDIYVSPEHIDRTASILKEKGYQYYQTTTIYHMSFVKSGIEIELHNTLPGIPKGKSGESLRFLKNMDKRAITCTINNVEYSFPNTCDNGIIQMCHILHHLLDEGVNLRLLCDWMMLVKNKITDEVWTNELSKIYVTAGLDRMAKLLTKTCVLYLGLDAASVKWCMDISERECEHFITYIFEQVDREIEEHIKKAESEHKEPVYEGKLKKNTWEYNGSHYLFHAIKRNIAMMLMGERSIRSIIKIMKSRNNNSKLLLDLGLFSKQNVKDYSK